MTAPRLREEVELVLTKLRAKQRNAKGTRGQSLWTLCHETIQVINAQAAELAERDKKIAALLRSLEKKEHADSP